MKTIIAAVFAVLAALGGSYYAGWHQRGVKELADQAVEREQHQAWLDAERERGNKLAVELEQEKRNVKTVTVEVVKEIPKVTTVYVERGSNEAKPIPPAIYTYGFVRLYNSALRPELPKTAGEFAYPAGTTNITRAEVGTADILTVHAINAGKYAECRAQLNKLIDWHEGKSPQ